MKKLILLAGLLVIFVTCKNEKNTSPATDENTPEMIEETDVGIIPNETDLDFEAALAAFRINDFEGAAKYINIAIDDIKKSTTTSDEATKNDLEKVVSELQSLADEVKSGLVTSEDELQQIFAHVDMVTSHYYFVLTKTYAVNSPEKTKVTFRKAGDRMERAVQKLRGVEQAEGKSLRDKIRADLARGDMKANEIGNAAGKHVEKLVESIKKHAEKLGIKPKPSDD